MLAPRRGMAEALASNDMVAKATAMAVVLMILVMVVSCFVVSFMAWGA
jgi:hypothetical protein